MLRMCESLPVEAEALTRVCNKCGQEKPIIEFRLMLKWRKRYCMDCEREQMRDYHRRTWPDRYARDHEIRKQRTRGFYHGTLKPRNLALYGKTASPRDEERAKNARRENRKLTGYGKTEAQRTQGRQHYKLLRTKAIALYGGKCECCGEARYDMLTFDHKAKEPRETRKCGVALVYDALHTCEELGYPNDRYQLLCWNCNASRGHYGYCPHDTDRGSCECPSRVLKLEMIATYGGRCVICGESRWEFLTIDHINGGGTQHRASVNGNLYSWLRRKGWPRDKYQLLCFNCNCSVKRNKWSNKQTHDNVTCERMV